MDSIEEARRIHFALSPLFTALFYETNPIPVKTALGMMGKIDPELRLPLCAMATETKDQLTQGLKGCRPRIEPGSAWLQVLIL